jgi:uncharacterized phiE125 gp8 family phage protein
MFPSGLGGYHYYGRHSSYGSLGLTEASPAQSFAEPIDIDEIQSYLKIPTRNPPDQAEDDTLGAFIIGAREQAEILQGRDLVRKQYDLVFDYWPCERIELRDLLVSVDLARYRDSDGNYTTLNENTDYVVDTAKHPGMIVPPYGQTWPTFTPWPSSALLVRFTSGPAASSAFWSDAGARIRIGMKLLISAWYNNRLPFEKGANVVAEYPYAVTSCLSYGALPRIR